MSRIRFPSVLVLLALLLSAGTGAVIIAQDDNAVENEVVFSVPIGSGAGEIGYEGLSKEMLPWGPTALTVGENGTFYIVDSANNRIQRYDVIGSLLSPINFGGEVIGVTDIEVEGDSLLVLDVAAMTPAVRRLTMNGTLVQSYPIPKTFGEDEMLWDGMSGIHIGPGGEVYIVVENVRAVVQLTDQTGAPLTNLRATAGFPDAEGRTYSIQNADWAVDPHTGEVLVRDQSGDVQRIVIQVPHTLAGLRYLQTGCDGSFFIVVEELFYDGTLHVDQTVHRYGSDGNLLGMARIPLNDFYVPVENGIAVGPDGNVYALVPKRDRVEIQRLTFRPELEPIFPGEETVVTDTSAFTGVGTPGGIRGCRSRTAMMDVAWGYVNNSKYLSSTNTDGSCANRTKPRYIGGAGNYGSVAYDANGWDTVSGYNSMMHPGTYQAGDRSFGDGGWASCSRGVDCSGFVSRIWGESQHLSTRDIPDYSWSMGSQYDFLPGDVLNKYDYHVAAFHTYCYGGATVFHSTTCYSYDRVVRRCHPWSFFDGYSARRYNNVCP